MAQRKITQNQRRRIAKSKAQKFDTLNEADTPTFLGQVIANFGKYAEVQCKDKAYHCKIRQNLGALVVGDEVIISVTQDNDAVITAIKPRNSRFYRVDEKGREKLICANVTQVFVVMALEPEPSWLLLDSYLAAIEILKLPVCILFNKVDIKANTFKDKILLYQDLNYPVLRTSVKQVTGLDDLTRKMRGECSIFVGQSGVGKSSLIQAVLPKASLTIGDLHDKTRLGTHTTSTARLYFSQNQGKIIDSPGIRDFNLWQMSAQALSQAFREFIPYLKQCKFRDCTHLHEPQCAVRKAQDEGIIAPSRLTHYHTILQRFTVAK